MHAARRNYENIKHLLIVIHIPFGFLWQNNANNIRYLEHHLRPAFLHALKIMYKILRNIYQNFNVELSFKRHI